MQNLMNTLFMCSVTMSVLALLFLILAPLLSRRYRPKWQYYAWLVIVIGFIIPWRPHFNFDFLKAATLIQPIVIPQPFVQNITLVPAIGEQASVSTISWLQIVFFLWLVGTLCTVCYQTFRHFRFMRMVKRWSDDITDKQTLGLLQELKSEMSISKQVGLQLCPCVGSPMMIGFVNPCILLPTLNLSKDELSFILKHELVHYRRKDLWYKCLLLIATAIHWFNPVVYFMAKAIDIQCELSCDGEVVRSTNADIRQQYSETIIGTIRYQSKQKTALSTNFYGGKKGMKKRIFSIMDTNKKKAGVAIVSSVLLLTMGTGMVFAANALPLASNNLNIVTTQDTVDKFAVYAKYGLTYDKSVDRLYYNGELVRYFEDVYAVDKTSYVTNEFSKTDGKIDVHGVRNAMNEIVGVEKFSQADYDARTEQMQNPVKSSGPSTGNGNTQSIVVGASSGQGNGGKTEGPIQDNGSNQTMDEMRASLAKEYEVYAKYGLTYNKDTGRFYYNDKLVRYFEDKMTSNTMIKIPFEDGTVDVHTVRNVSGELTGVQSFSQSDFNNRKMD